MASVLAFASVYKRLGDDIGKRFDTATAQTLILQKLRSYNDSDITVGKSGDTQYISFADTIDGEKYITYIYAYGGELKELFVSYDAPFSEDGGNTLLPAENFTAETEGRPSHGPAMQPKVAPTICFTVTCDGVTTSSHYSLHGGKAVGV